MFFLNFVGICCLNAYVKFLFGNVLCVVNVIFVMAVSSLEKGLNKPKYWQRDSNHFDECLSTNLFLTYIYSTHCRHFEWGTAPLLLMKQLWSSYYYGSLWSNHGGPLILRQSCHQ